MMELKKYLNEITIKVFLYLLYENESTKIPTALRIEKENFVIDIFKNELAKIFTIERNKEVFGETDFKNLSNDNVVDYAFINEPLDINLIDKDSLTTLMSEYIDNFKNGYLKSSEDNFYNFSKCILETSKLLDSYYKDYGRDFNIDLALNKNELGNKVYDNKIRLVESILYMSDKNYIIINGCNIKSDKENEYLIFIDVTLNKTFDEILDIEKYWTYGYGDIRINEEDGVAFYKKNRFPAKSAKTKAFKLLCYLVKNHRVKTPIEEAYEAIGPHIEKEIKSRFKSKTRTNKDKTEDFIKAIKINLKILDDENPTISLGIVGDYILFVSNPSNK